MLHIDLRLNPKVKLEYPAEWDVFEVHPDHDDLNIVSFLDKVEFYPGVESEFKNLVEDKLSQQLTLWFSKNLENMPPGAIKFCIEHIYNSFSMQYSSCYATADMLLSKYRDITLICSPNIKRIDLEWNSELINLLAFLDAGFNKGIGLNLLEIEKGAFSELLKDGMVLDSYRYIYKDIIENETFNNHSIINKILHKKVIYCSLTSNRVNVCNSESKDVIALIPKTLDNNEEYTGGGNLFFGAKFKRLSYPYEAVVCKTNLSIKLEEIFFNSIWNHLFSYFDSIKKNIDSLIRISERDEKKELILEEIVDVEVLPLLSSAIEAGYNISMAQHSIMPLPRLTNTRDYLNNSQHYSEIQKIYYRSNSAYKLYKGGFGDSIELLKDERNPKIIKYQDYKFNNDSTSIIIFENAFFYAYGARFNISQIANDILAFVSRMIAMGFKNYIWRQRDGRISPLFKLLVDTFSNANFIFNCGTPVADLAKHAKFAVGFGGSSTISIDFIANGGIYFFGSSYQEDYEYIYEVNEFYKEFGIGPLCISEKIKSITLLNNFEYFRERQLSMAMQKWL